MHLNHKVCEHHYPSSLKTGIWAQGNMLQGSGRIIGPFTCTNRMHFARIEHKPAQITQMLVHVYVVVGTDHKSSENNATLKIDVTLPLLCDTLIQTSWSSCSMLLGQNFLPATQLWVKLLQQEILWHIPERVPTFTVTMLLMTNTAHVTRAIDFNFLLSLFYRADR